MSAGVGDCYLCTERKCWVSQLVFSFFCCNVVFVFRDQQALEEGLSCAFLPNELQHIPHQWGCLDFSLLTRGWCPDSVVFSCFILFVYLFIFLIVERPENLGKKVFRKNCWRAWKSVKISTYFGKYIVHWNIYVMFMEEWALISIYGGWSIVH